MVTLGVRAPPQECGGVGRRVRGDADTTQSIAVTLWEIWELEGARLWVGQSAGSSNVLPCPLSKLLLNL